MQTPGSELRHDLGIGLVALAVLLAAFALLGIGFDGDAMGYLLWGRELATGAHLNHCNPALTAPKLFPILVAAAGHWAPGQGGAEWFYAVATALLGAGLVVASARLARRLGGTAAGLIAALLVLGHMQFIQYVLNGQSTIHESFFLVWALVVAAREKPTPGAYCAAAALLFMAGLCRPEASVLAPALGLALWLRLGWRRVGWPALVTAIGLASIPANLAFSAVAFGSPTYAANVPVEYQALVRGQTGGLGLGFAVGVGKTLFHYANRSPVMLFLAVVGVGLALVRERGRFAAVLLFPLPMIASAWLMVARGMNYNQRCFYFMSFLLIVLAAHGVARLAAWAAQSGEFLGSLSPRGRAFAFALVALLAVAPDYATRPLPRDGRQYASLRRMADYLGAQLQGEPKPVRLLVSDETTSVFYRLGLDPDRSCVLAIRILRAGDGKLPADVDWCAVNRSDLSWKVPADWPLELAWEDTPRGAPGTAVYRRVR